MFKRLVVACMFVVATSTSAAAIEASLGRLDEDRRDGVTKARELYDALVHGEYSCELLCRGEAERTLAHIRELDERFTRIVSEARKATNSRQQNYYLAQLESINAELINLRDAADPYGGRAVAGREAAKETLAGRVASAVPITGTIKGRVTVSGSAPGAARVTLTDPYGNEYSGPTDRRGEYVQSSLMPGQYKVVAEADDRRGTKTGTLKSRSTLTVNIDLTATRRR